MSASPTDAKPTGYCLPVSVLDRQVLLYSLHQVLEALGKDFLLGERLAVDQTCPQFSKILVGDRTSVRTLTLNLHLQKAVGQGLDQLSSAWGS